MDEVGRLLDATEVEVINKRVIITIGGEGRLVKTVYTIQPELLSIWVKGEVFRLRDGEVISEEIAISPDGKSSVYIWTG